MRIDISNSNLEKEEIANALRAQIVNAIVKGYKEYTLEKINKIDKAVQKRTNEALKEVIANSPVRQEISASGRRQIPKSGVILVYGGIEKSNHQPGAYKKGWIKHVSVKNGKTIGFVRNKSNFEIVHLLELGFDYKRHGYKGQHVNPSPLGGHVNPAEEKARADLAKDIEKILEEN